MKIEFHAILCESCHVHYLKDYQLFNFPTGFVSSCDGGRFINYVTFGINVEIYDFLSLFDKFYTKIFLKQVTKSKSELKSF